MNGSVEVGRYLLVKIQLMKMSALVNKEEKKVREQACLSFW
jgi:hypothetical protein